jgi:hypothetical protein
MMGWAWCLICVGLNISLYAWVRYATWARNFKLVRTHSLGGEGGGSIFWKTPDTALYSTYVSTLCIK